MAQNVVALDAWSVGLPVAAMSDIGGRHASQAVRSAHRLLGTAPDRHVRGRSHTLHATIFTFGLLLWSTGPLTRRLAVVPALWSIVATSAAVNLGMAEDFGLVAAALVAVPFIFTPRRLAPYLSDAPRPVSTDRSRSTRSSVLS